MPRPRHAIPAIPVKVRVREDLHTRITLSLFSELEGRIPEGAIRAFFEDLLIERFEGRRLDLAPYAGSDAGALIVSGSPAAIERLKQLLQKESSHA